MRVQFAWVVVVAGDRGWVKGGRRDLSGRDGLGVWPLSVMQRVQEVEDVEVAGRVHEAVMSEVFLEGKAVSARPTARVAAVGRAAVPSSETSSAPPPPIAGAEAHVEAAGHRPAPIVAAVASIATHVF